MVLKLHYVYTCLAFLMAYYHFFGIYGAGNSKFLILLLNSVLLPFEFNIVFVLQTNICLCQQCKALWNHNYAF
jgi:hypothetical protein